jgi:hypothetical protein
MMQRDDVEFAVEGVVANLHSERLLDALRQRPRPVTRGR